MKLIVLALALFISGALSECPSLKDMDCQYYLPLDKMACNKKSTFIEVNGERCESCPLCEPLPEEGVACPEIRCNPNIPDRMDCGRFDYMMKMMVNGEECDACQVHVYDCSDISWTGYNPDGPVPPSPPA